MTALTPADRDKLVAVLGKLGSDHDGERASAALLASRLMKQRGLSWADVIGGNVTPPPRPSFSGALWHADLALARRHCSLCRAWEKGFVESLARQRTVSTKQRQILAEIATALRVRGLT